MLYYFKTNKTRCHKINPSAFMLMKLNQQNRCNMIKCPYTVPNRWESVKNVQNPIGFIDINL